MVSPSWSLGEFWMESWYWVHHDSILNPPIPSSRLHTGLTIFINLNHPNHILWTIFSVFSSVCKCAQQISVHEACRTVTLHAPDYPGLTNSIMYSPKTPCWAHHDSILDSPRPHPGVTKTPCWAHHDSILDSPRPHPGVTKTPCWAHHDSILDSPTPHPGVTKTPCWAHHDSILDSPRPHPGVNKTPSWTHQDSIMDSPGLHSLTHQLLTSFINSNYSIHN